MLRAILLHKKLRYSAIWDTGEPFTQRGAWIDILLRANQEAEELDSIHIKRGQVYLSEVALAQSWQWSLTKVRSFLKKLTKEGMITTKKTSKNTIITIVNYDFYQNNPPEKNIKKAKSFNKETKQVFSYWQKVLNHPGAKLTPDRAKKINGRLGEGYTVKELKRTVDGCKASPYHQGQNERRIPYHNIDLLFRNGEKVEFFWQYLSLRETPGEVRIRGLREEAQKHLGPQMSEQELAERRKKGKEALQEIKSKLKGASDEKEDTLHARVLP